MSAGGFGSEFRARGTRITEDRSIVQPQRMNITNKDDEQQSFQLPTAQDYKTGIELFKKKEFKKAIAACDKTLKLDPQNEQAINTKKLAQEALQQSAVEYEKAISLYRAGQYTGALIAIGNSITISPNSKKFQWTKNRIEESIKKDIESIKLFQHGEIYYDGGVYDKALAVYRKAIELNPLNAKYHFSIAKTYAKLKQHGYDSAIESLDEALRLDSIYTLAYCYKAKYLQKSGRVSEALQCYCEASKIIGAGDDVRLYTKTELEDIDRLLKQYKTALESKLATKEKAVKSKLSKNSDKDDNENPHDKTTTVQMIDELADLLSQIKESGVKKSNFQKVISGYSQKEQESVVDIIELMSNQVNALEQELSRLSAYLGQDSKTKAMIDKIKSQPVLAQYYDALKLALNKIFLAAFVIASGKVERAKNETSDQIISKVAFVGKGVPLISAAVSIVEFLAQYASDAHYIERFKQLSTIAEDPVKSTRLAEMIARYFTLEQTSDLLFLNKKANSKNPGEFVEIFKKCINLLLSKEGPLLEKAKSDTASILDNMMSNKFPTDIQDVAAIVKHLMITLLESTAIFDMTVEYKSKTTDEDGSSGSSSTAGKDTSDSTSSVSSTVVSPTKSETGIEEELASAELAQQLQRQQILIAELLFRHERLESLVAKVQMPTPLQPQDQEVGGGDQAQLLLSKAKTDKPVSSDISDASVRIEATVVQNECRLANLERGWAILAERDPSLSIEMSQMFSDTNVHNLNRTELIGHSNQKSTEDLIVNDGSML